MTAFVTGATGFIGRALVARLSALGCRTRCLVRRPASSPWLRRLPGVEVVPGDLLEPGTYAEALRGAETVFHLAGATKATSRGAFFTANAEGTARLAGVAAAPGSRVRKVVLASSLAVAGPHTAAAPAREEEPPRPVSHYGESKLEGEARLREGGRSYAWTALRLPVVFGPFDRDLLVCFRAAARGLIPLARGGRLELSLLHVEDAVTALLSAGFSEAADGRVYYAADPTPRTTADLAGCLRAAAGGGRTLPLPALLLRLAGLGGDLHAALTGRPSPVCSQKMKEACQAGWVCATDRIRDELGFRAAVDLPSAFRETFHWYRERGWL